MSLHERFERDIMFLQ